MNATRPWVDAFADEMEAKLAENRHKGDREGWAKMGPLDLLARLQGEVGELTNVLAGLLDKDDPYPEFADAVVRECADVANFAMMIADVAGGMQPKGPPR